MRCPSNRNITPMVCSTLRDNFGVMQKYPLSVTNNVLALIISSSDSKKRQSNLSKKLATGKSHKKSILISVDTLCHPNVGLMLRSLGIGKNVNSAARLVV